MTTITIKVTKQLIKNAKNNETANPIALAIRAQTSFDLVKAGKNRIELKQSKKVSYCTIPTPKIAAEFLQNFFQGNKVNPIEFQMNIKL